uniref:TNFR-Cys domain-containing protein n=1 Tax=Scophthalmus maximus TaxID=52904 RepID=A0A8D3C6W2_SCOMX
MIILPVSSCFIRVPCPCSLQMLLPVMMMMMMMPPPSPALTFLETDPATGARLECDSCAPGTYLRASCTPTQRSVCATCPPGSYTERWNYIRKCLRCGVCGHNQVVVSACAADRDCQCECKAGFHGRGRYDVCMRHSQCPSGQGVLTRGTAEEDTVCQVCPNGTFSDAVSSVQNCTEHRGCAAAAGLQLLLRGCTWHDSVCVSCTELREGGSYLREILPAFFVHHKTTTRRLRRVVHNLPTEDGKKQTGLSALGVEELNARLSAWVASAGERQIRQLPEVLSKIGAQNAGERLQSKLQRIDSHLNKLCGALGNEVDGV